LKISIPVWKRGVKIASTSGDDARPALPASLIPAAVARSTLT